MSLWAVWKAKGGGSLIRGEEREKTSECAGGLMDPQIEISGNSSVSQNVI